MNFLLSVVRSTKVRWLVIVVVVALAAGWFGYRWGGHGNRVGTVSRKSLQEGNEALNRGVDSLRTQIETMTGVSAPPRPSAPALPYLGVATDEEAVTVLNHLRARLVDLAMLANQLKAREPVLAAKRSLRVGFTEPGAIEQVVIDHLTANRSITLINRGSENVINPQVIVNGQKNWFDNDLLLNEIIKPGMSDRDKAVAIWRFIVDNRIHDTPAHPAIELHDPVRWLNIYGYGFCDDAATNFMRLVEKAGFKARIWGLSGHVVPEVWYDNGWHLLDPDGEIYYLEDDNQTIASVETLEQRADLIRRQQGGFYRDIDMMIEHYTTTDNNRLAPWYTKSSETDHTMGFRLRPGESLMRSWSNWGLYFTAGYLEEPKRYGNGRFLFEPVFKDDLYQQGSEQSDGLMVKLRDEAMVLTTAESASNGTLVYRFQSPYPYLSGNVQLTGEIAKEGMIQIEFSEQGKVWQIVEALDQAGSVDQTIPLQGYFRNGYGRPFYSYFIRLTLQSSPVGATTLSVLQYRSDIQLAPHALPTLQAGENTIQYRDDTPGRRDLEVLFEYDDVE